MLDEAHVAHERVLADLGRRRSLLQAQVEELRQGRDRLLEAYRVVKRTFLDATEALAHVEARAATERALAPGPDNIAGEITVTESETQVLEVVLPDATANPDANAERGAGNVDAPTELADVDSLFARIRAGQTAAPGESDPDTILPGAPGEADAETVAVTEVDVVVLETAAAVDATDAPAPPPRPSRGTRRLLRNPLLEPIPGGPGTSPPSIRSSVRS